MDPTPLARLEREWDALQGPRASACFRSWARHEPALAGFEQPAVLVNFLRSSAPPERKDAVLAALLRSRREPLAGRLLLEAFIPGLKVIARRVMAAGASREEAWASIFAHAWVRIATYPLGRRPERIAANVLLDTLRDTLGELRQRRRLLSELPSAPLETAAPCTDRTDVDALLTDAVASGVISLAEAQLVLATRFGERTLAEVSADTDTSYNTIKVRRQRAERRLIIGLGYASEPRGRQTRRFSRRA